MAKPAARGVSRWWWWSGGLLCAGLFIWYAGPLFAFADHRPLESVSARVVLLVLLVAALAGEAAWSAWRADGRHRKLFEALAAPARGGSSATGVIEGRFDAALAAMRAASPATQRPWWKRLVPASPADDERPWYLFIGSPGSGSGTALVHSGLKFSLAAQLGSATVQGVGGTRNCDWWFTDRAVLIDTAGRYTTQDSDARQDAREWQTFLALLRKHRPRQPINGVLVTVSVQDLLQLRPAVLREQARSVHDRLQELTTGLGHRFPVYLLITKADLLAGFIEFFDGMDRDERAQVWGATFAYGQSDEDLPARVGERLDVLIDRLRTRAFVRLQQERDPTRRAPIHLFADQLALLKPALLAFVAAAFPGAGAAVPAAAPAVPGDAPAANAASPEPATVSTPVTAPAMAGAQPAGPMPLRGFYFTSGTQEGSPIDRVMGMIARRFSLADRLLPAARGSGRAFFISRLLSDVVFAEASLAGTARRWQRRRGQWRWGLSIAALAVAGIAIAGWTWSAINNARYVAAVAGKANVLGDALRDAAAFTDLQALTPLYTALHALADARGVDPANPPPGFGYGLYQGDKLRQATEQAYQRMLQQTLAPVLAGRLLKVLRESGEQPALQYEALRTYLMLSQSERLDRQAVRRWVELDLSGADPASRMDADTRRELLTHVDALMQRNGFQQAVPVDARAVADARQALLRVPPAQRLLANLKRQVERLGLPDFPSDAADGDGAGAGSLLVRADGQPLRGAIPAVYTREAWRQGFGPTLDGTVAAALEDEAWVLGSGAAAPAGARQRLVDEVRRRYLDEYGGRWEALLAELTVPPVQSAADLGRLLRRLADGDSALRKWLQAAVREVTLPPLDGVPRGATAAFDARFAALRRYVAGEAGAPSALDGLLAQLDALRKALADEGRAGEAGGELLGRLKSDVAAAPEPVRALAGTVVAAAATQLQRQQRDTAIQALRRSLLDGCRQMVAGRYPFVPGARQEASLADFARLFAPGGLFDEFFTQYLAPHVDTSARPWRLREAASAGGEPMPDIGGAEGLLQFERAGDIRRAFFDGQSGSPALRLQFKPLEMDPSALQFTLDIGGQVLKYAHGPSLPKPVQWPGPGGAVAVRMQMYPAGASGDAGVRYAGPWAMFRMFDAARVAELGGPERLRVVLTVDAQPVTFEVTSPRSPNPLRLPSLQAFKCPGQQG